MATAQYPFIAGEPHERTTKLSEKAVPAQFIVWRRRNSFPERGGTPRSAAFLAAINSKFMSKTSARRPLLLRSAVPLHRKVYGKSHGVLRDPLSHGH